MSTDYLLFCPTHNKVVDICSYQASGFWMPVKIRDELYKFVYKHGTCPLEWHSEHTIPDSIQFIDEDYES